MGLAHAGPVALVPEPRLDLHHLGVRLVQLLQLRTVALSASLFEPVGQPAHVICLHQGVAAFVHSGDAPWRLFLQYIGRTCQLCQLEIVFEFVAMLSLTHSKFDLVFVRQLLRRDEKVVERVSDLLQLSLICIRSCARLLWALWLLGILVRAKFVYWVRPLDRHCR